MRCLSARPNVHRSSMALQHAEPKRLANATSVSIAIVMEILRHTVRPLAYDAMMRHCDEKAPWDSE